MNRSDVDEVEELPQPEFTQGHGCYFQVPGTTEPKAQEVESDLIWLFHLGGVEDVVKISQCVSGWMSVFVVERIVG